MSAGDAPPVNRPVKVALEIDVFWLRAKSSADSIPIRLVPLGRDAVAMRPSGFPVLKKNGIALTDVADISKAVNRNTSRALLLITLPPQKKDDQHKADSNGYIKH